MDAFRRGEIQVLVCTSVVEVGVDVPNATLMTIESGQRFGLAQLHQFRGRISRGTFPGFCCVFGDPQTDESRERLKAFVATTDGFELAETDFKLRGPGDIFGTRQSRDILFMRATSREKLRRNLLYMCGIIAFTDHSVAAPLICH